MEASIMKKNILIIGIAAILMVGTSCATSKKATVASPPVPAAKVIVGAEGFIQPDWVYKTPTADDRHFESGYGLMSNRQNSIKRAETEAKNKIAGWISTNVEEVVVTYLNDAGSLGDRQALDAMEVISKQVAEATLVGVTTEDVWVDKEGGIWVLASIPLANIEYAFEPAAEALVDTFTPSAAAEAANAKMKEAFAKLLKGD